MNKKTYETLQIRQAQDLKNKRSGNILGSIFVVFLIFFSTFIIVHFNLTNDRYPNLYKQWPFKWGCEEKYLEGLILICFLTPILITSYLFLWYQKRKVKKILNSQSIKNNKAKVII